ncbi:Der GTPase-activating protein YihI [Salinimonas iocasae]|uniref:Der GTPase-activating protein YihI n=1 Tax=Salinimonas iocasae TaxID=2572577 RepID=A0A5B7Y845_9ALTE|nr:Der GTPase-activating protein YihI [Salinimonas iocasae]QCZ91967.1 GTPase-activating protein [Salinimonas iocasae]
MPRSKKSRKVGQIGVRKDPDRKPARPSVPTGKKPGKGKQPGNRNAVEQAKSKGGGAREKRDPRIGSKRPVPLVKSQAKKYATPAEELAALEADNKLALLLDKLDNGDTISVTEQQYVDEKLDRHAVLCDLMGIDLNADEEESEQDDPLDKLDAINPDDFKK